MTDEQTQPPESEPAAEGLAPQGPGERPSDRPPNRIAIDPNSEHFDAEQLGRGIGIRFKGSERKDVEEYCISEGWVRVQAGKTVDRRGRPLTLKLNGPVEAWYQDLGDDPPVARKD